LYIVEVVAVDLSVVEVVGVVDLSLFFDLLSSASMSVAETIHSSYCDMLIIKENSAY